MPKNPDASPMDFDIWGILKRRLQKRKLYMLASLKRDLKDNGKSWNKKCYKWNIAVMAKAI